MFSYEVFIYCTWLLGDRHNRQRFIIADVLNACFIVIQSQNKANKDRLKKLNKCKDVFQKHLSLEIRKIQGKVFVLNYSIWLKYEVGVFSFIMCFSFKMQSIFNNCLILGDASFDRVSQTSVDLKVRSCSLSSGTSVVKIQTWSIRSSSSLMQRVFTTVSIHPLICFFILDFFFSIWIYINVIY